MDETERRALAARLVAEIKSLKIGATRDDISNVKRLRSDKIVGLAERLSFPGELPCDYSLFHLVKRIDALAVQHPGLLITQDQARGERIAGTEKNETSEMTAEQKLDHANRLAYLVANAMKREGDE